MNKIAVAFNDPTSAQTSGITVGGKKYFFGWIDEPADKIPVLFCAQVCLDDIELSCFGQGRSCG